jgi:hypothetical protein
MEMAGRDIVNNIERSIGSTIKIDKYDNNSYFVS